ncbi:iron-sulfur cluster-binding protein [hydrocarbon metagenome]|uniref:Iron-sulfur cluster-binding protein n=1 Tax=hydrocarbon metagenome TaxID=938273 RepID=A0A0W8E354_9ZZZZ
MKRIIVKAEACDGCGICQLVCSAHKAGQWHPAFSRIKIKRHEEFGLNVPVVCMHCTNAPCETFCVMNLIYKEHDSNLTLRHEDRCIGCRACEIACPFSVAVLDPISETVVNCDLCGGDPQCVNLCPNGALSFIDISEAIDSKRRQTAGSQILEAARGLL